MIVYAFSLCSSEGVAVHPNKSVKQASMPEGKFKVTADDGTELS